MFTYEKRNSIGLFAVLAGLWFINILILIFGLPFLLLIKAQEVFVKAFKKPRPKKTEKQNSTKYFPQQIDSKL